MLVDALFLIRKRSWSDDVFLSICNWEHQFLNNLHTRSVIAGCCQSNDSFLFRDAAEINSWNYEAFERCLIWGKVFVAHKDVSLMFLSLLELLELSLLLISNCVYCFSTGVAHCHPLVAAANIYFAAEWNITKTDNDCKLVDFLSVVFHGEFMKL